MKDRKITLNDAKHDQVRLRSNLGEIKKGPKNIY